MGKFGDEKRFRQRLAKARSDGFSIETELGFDLTVRDDEIMSRLSNACCYHSQWLYFKLQERWDKRKKAAEDFAKGAKKIIQLIATFKAEEKWIQEWFRNNSVQLHAVEVPDSRAVRIKMSFLELLLAEIAQVLLSVRKIRKPRAEPENYYYFYLMDAFLTWLVRTKNASRRRRVGGKPNIHAVIATYVKAWGSGDPRLRALGATGVAWRVGRFTSENSAVAKVVKRDPLAHVKVETRIDPKIDTEK